MPSLVPTPEVKKQIEKTVEQGVSGRLKLICIYGESGSCDVHAKCTHSFSWTPEEKKP
jgi:hypothetical protein